MNCIISKREERRERHRDDEWINSPSFQSRWYGRSLLPDRPTGSLLPDRPTGRGQPCPYHTDAETEPLSTDVATSFPAAGSGAGEPTASLCVVEYDSGSSC